MAIIFGLVGIALLVAGILMYRADTRFKNTATETTAVITQIDAYSTRNGRGHNVTQYNVYVAFTVHGKEYTGALGYHTGGMREGQTVTIYYNADDPGDFRGMGSSWGIWGLIVTGAICLLISIMIAVSLQKESIPMN